MTRNFWITMLAMTLAMTGQHLSSLPSIVLSVLSGWIIGSVVWKANQYDKGR